MKIALEQTLTDIASLENLLLAWEEFLPGKRAKPDIQDFNLHLMDNIISLHEDVVNKTYRHGGYSAFKISDPKPRDIHKASVRDRLLHHAIYRVLYPFFDRAFVADSFSCRNGKGTHRAIKRLNAIYHKASRNNTRTVWALQCDIRKFFASIDHDILMAILAQRIYDQDILWLLCEITGSFSSTRPGVGLPLGNLTSQLLVNVFMNEFDQFVKHRLREKYYIRYADDFIILSDDRKRLDLVLAEARYFLTSELRLKLHPEKVSIKTFASGIDFLGWINFPDHRVLRTATKRRMIKRLAVTQKPEVVASYAGLLKHGNAFGLMEEFLSSRKD